MIEALMPERITNSDTETEQAGRDLAAILERESDELICVSLYGDLGAGKTAFVRGMASLLSEGSRVSSPTYAIVNEYRKGKRPFYHYDMYRISTEEDLYAASFYDYLDEGALIAVEWSENVAQFLEEPYVKVDIAVTGPTDRTITIEGAKSV